MENEEGALFEKLLIFLHLRRFDAGSCEGYGSYLSFSLFLEKEHIVQEKNKLKPSIFTDYLSTSYLSFAILCYVILPARE